jgi:hypothetical protein
MSPSPRRPCRLEGTPTRSSVPWRDENGQEMQEKQQEKKEAGGKPLDRVSRPRTNPRKDRERRGADRRRPRSRALTTEQYRGESSWP